MKKLNSLRVKLTAYADEIKASWQEDISAFKEQRGQYLLYEE